MDMEAGIEHLGRATAQSMDAMIVVVDPSGWSVQTAHRVRKLAGDIGMKKVFAVANRLSAAALDPVRQQLGDIPLLGDLPEDPRLAGGIVRTAADGRLEACEALTANLPAVERILAELETRI